MRKAAPDAQRLGHKLGKMDTRGTQKGRIRGSQSRWFWCKWRSLIGEIIILRQNIIGFKIIKDIYFLVALTPRICDSLIPEETITMDPPPRRKKKLKKCLLFCDYSTFVVLRFNAKPRTSRLLYLIVFIFVDLGSLTSIQQIDSLEKNARTVNVENHSQRRCGPIFYLEISF